MSEEMKELPILFITDMVKAILDDRKTVTRRVIKTISVRPDKWEEVYWDGEIWTAVFADGGMEVKCPYQKGDLLYVREAWWAVEVDEIGIQYFVYEDEFETISSGGRVPKPKELRFLDRQDWKWGRHPSIHMLKKYARIWLEVLGVRAERLQEITKEDAIREGIEIGSAHGEPAYYLYDERLHYTPDPIESFQTLWDKLNKKRGYGWDNNPWVWRYEFKVKDNGM